MTPFIAAFSNARFIVCGLWIVVICSLVAASPGHASASENCMVCHRITLSGSHGKLACLDCHVSESATVANPAASGADSPCVKCHKGLGALFTHAMATRADEMAFVGRNYGRVDKRFFEKNCTGCHIKSCLDCHEGGGHRIATPDTDRCLSCHRGYFVGWDYAGRAPREDSLRYQRGKSADGENFLTMRPDIHHEKGIGCKDCHSMKSLAEGKRSSKRCIDCHNISRRPVEHRIQAHLDRLECYACHSAWAPQEYGTFFIRFTESPSREDFWLKGSETTGEYLRSSYLKRQDEPPLGLNSRGKVSPVRPQFIAYYTHVRRERVVGRENRLLAAEWKAYFPHTTQRGTVMCDRCHDAPARFLLEPRQDRIFRMGEDGMTLESFFDRTGQKVSNGAFIPVDRYRRLSERSPAFQKGYLEKWQLFSGRVEDSSIR